ncbi:MULTISPECIES: peptidylprolyl isomerase [Thermodesulfovibrio]|uniref:peptidylprolyl isomerase n=1 Tax=Thermodesulfovibrio TaxID=28261 RepID=UPI00262AC7AD|nr:peptidylprolyl isomerase [Thermodesulfovibrio sp.]
MKKSFFIFLLLLFLLFSVQALTFSISFAQEKFFVDRVLAVVNREVVTWSELYKYMEFISRDEIKNLNPDEKFKYFKQREEEFLERLIDTKLQIEEAERYGIFVSDSEIEAAINDIKRKYGLNDKEFEESLKKEGMTLNDYKKMMKEQIIIGRAVNSLVRSKIIITDSEINSYISSHPELSCEEEGYYVSQIFIKMRDNQEQVKDKINEAIKRLIQGESFSKVASQLSEDASARTGGSIGLLKRSEISPELSNVFSKMNVGGISEPLVTANGVYIFKLDGLCFKKNSETLKNYVRTIIEDEKFKKEYRLWIRGLRQRAYIEVMD